MSNVVQRIDTEHQSVGIAVGIIEPMGSNDDAIYRDRQKSQKGGLYMNRLSFFLFPVVLVAWGAEPTVAIHNGGGAPRIYIQPQEGFESFLAAAIVKKHVPAVVTQNKDEAQFLLTAGVQSKTESAGSKVARCLFLYCAGINGTQSVSVQLVNTKTQEVAWAYNVNKGSAVAYQSTAEAVAKHLKHFLEDHPQ